jgi:hypothetical protein
VDEAFVKIGMPELHQSLQRVVEGNQRLESKVDTALSIQTLRLDHLVRDLTRLEAHLEDAKRTLEDRLDEEHTRVDEISRRPVVTPKMMLAAVTIMGIVATIVMGILNLVVQGG